MKITCPSCSAKYSIADDKVQARLAKIRCRKCGATIVIDGKANPPNVYAADGGAAADSAGSAGQGASAGGEYSVDYAENDQRNMTLADIVTAYNAREITSETYVWAEGFEDWKPLGEIDEIVEALHQASDTGAAEPAWDASPAAEPAFSAAAEQPSPARAATSTRAAATDLFGGIEKAGSEEELATSAPHAEPAAPAAPAPTGARNESSVLFSLSALTSAAANKKPSVPAASSNREDSGLIDLKALTAGAAKAAEPAQASAGLGMMANAASLGVSPLGVPAPLGASPAPALGDMSFQQPQKSKIGLGLFIAAGLIVGLVAFALILKSGGSDETAPAVTAVVPVATPTPTPTPTAVPTPSSEAQPPATGTAEEEDAGAPEEKPKVVQRRYTPKKHTPAAQPKAGGASIPASQPTKPAPKKSACGCAPGDLQCAMRCAAGG